MKQLLKFNFLLVLTMTSVLFTACEGEDGEPGLQGEQGIDGKDGVDGEDAAGLDEATKNGNIVATFTGTYEGKAFTHTVDYKYAPTGIPYGSIWSEENESPTAQVERYAKPESNEYTEFSLNLDDTNSEFNTYVYAYIPVADKKFFFIQGYNDAFTDKTISEYSFNAATGELKMKYTATYPANEYYNATENDILVTVNVNVTLSQVLHTSPK